MSKRNMSAGLKVTVFVASSLDGYIARVDGDIEWLNEANSMVPDGEDCGYGELMKSVDAMVMGRKTYEKVLSFGSWPYGETPVWVVSSKPIAVADDISQTVRHSSESPQQICDRLRDSGLRHVYVDGGNTIQRFIAAGLVDELIITVIPILLGDGISLFGRLQNDVALRCLHAEAYDFGFVQLRYSVES